MGKKSVDSFMKGLSKGPYNYNNTSNKNSVKQKPKNQSNIEKPEKLVYDKKQNGWRYKSLVEKLDSLEKNVKGNSKQYNFLIEGEIIAPIIYALPRYIDVESWYYKNRELKIVLHESDSIKSLDGKILYTETKLIFESDYKQLLKDYPCVKDVISGLKKEGIKIVYDKKDIHIKLKLVKC